jgi:hypothetical protein
MDLTALEWELHGGLDQRRKEAEALAAREHLVRVLRTARRAAGPPQRRHGWTRRLRR